MQKPDDEEIFWGFKKQKKEKRLQLTTVNLGNWFTIHKKNSNQHILIFWEKKRKKKLTAFLWKIDAKKGSPSTGIKTLRANIYICCFFRTSVVSQKKKNFFFKKLSKASKRHWENISPKVFRNPSHLSPFATQINNAQIPSLF